LPVVLAPKAPRRLPRTIGAMAIMAAGMVVAVPSAHEITENRARFVLQDDNHLRGSLFVSYSSFLYEASGRAEPFTQFLLTWSAMPDAEFEQRLRSAHALLEQGTQVTIGGRPAAITSWAYPQLATVRTRIRDVTAATLVGSHVHEDPIEITFDVRSATAISDVHVRFPAALKTITVVSFRPHQIDLAAGAESPVLGFGGDAGAPRFTASRIGAAIAGLVVLALLLIVRVRSGRRR
jgi:hypothetical protein